MKRQFSWKRLVGPLLFAVTLLVLLPNMVTSAQAASKVYNDVAQFASTNGEPTRYWEWNRAYSASDLPKDDQWHRVLIVWDIDKQRRFLSKDTDYYEYSSSYRYFRNAPSFQGDSAMTMQPRFFTQDNLKAAFVKYVGMDSEYSQFPKYKIRLTDDVAGEPQRFVYSDYGTHRVTAPYMHLRNAEDLATPITFAIGDTSYVAHGNAKGFYSVSGCVDPMFETMKDGDQSVLGMGNSSAVDAWSSQDVALYVGKERSVGVFGSDFTVKAGDTYPIKSNAGEKTIVNKGVTITVEKGATLAISGRLVLNGQIINKGTVVLNRGAVVAPTDNNDTTSRITGSITCVGGDLVVMPKAFLYIDYYGRLTLREGSTCSNYGVINTYNGLWIDQSTLHNKLGAGLYTGHLYEGTLYALDEGIVHYDHSSGGSSTSKIRYVSGIGSECYSFKDWTHLGYGARIINDGTYMNNRLTLVKPNSDWYSGKPLEDNNNNRDHWYARKYLVNARLTNVSLSANDLFNQHTTSNGIKNYSIVVWAGE